MELYRNKLLLLILIILTVVLLSSCEGKKNEAPKAVNDTNIRLTTMENIVIDVLDNDTDDNNQIDTKTIEITTTAKLGSAVIENGKISYIANNAIGDDSFKYRVKDSQGMLSNIATVYIEITNADPKFTSTPVKIATEGINYQYIISFEDDNQKDILKLTANLPSWLSLNQKDNNNAILFGVASSADITTHEIVLELNDNINKPTKQQFSIMVNANNTDNKINFTSQAIKTTIIEESYSYAITTTSSNETPIAITVTTKPNWLELADNNDGTATLSGTAKKANLGEHQVVLQATDNKNNFVEQAFIIKVSELKNTISFNSQAILTATTGKLYSYKIAASDSEDSKDLIITAVTKPAWLNISDTTNGEASLSGTASDSDIGNHNVTLKATNSSGQFVEQNFAIKVTKPQLDLPSLKLASASITEGNSDSQKLIFNITLSSPSDDIVSFDYATTNGTAVAGSDYEVTNGTASMSKGTSSIKIEVVVFGDTDVEENETFKLVLSEPINATIETSEATGSILNDDANVSDIIPNPIVFVTQFPIQEDFVTITSTFGNHLASMQSAGRGGDLMIIYPDGSLKNLTKVAGFGLDGLQNQNAIAVRDPEVHWDAQKVIFSMVIGGPTGQYEYNDYYWQIYEVSGLAKDDTPIITKLANQPANYNNISPIYTSDDKIIFTSDRSRDGQRHLYPQLDEYEETPTVSGLWKLDPNSGNLTLLDHSPSGAFSPIIDSFGRVIYTRWDHLQRDQQADSDALGSGACTYCAFNYSGEEVNSVPTSSNEEIFPEPREDRTDLLAGTPYTGHFFNHFIPWMVNQDGTDHETINHIGRHELHDYFNRSRNDDSALEEGYVGNFERYNDKSIENLFQVNEDPNRAGYYVAVTAPEFNTHAAGQIVALSASINMGADQIKIDYITDPVTSSYKHNDNNNNLGLYREPLFLSDGTLVASYTSATDEAGNLGSRANPYSNYDFKLHILQKNGQYWQASQALTNGIKKDISYYDPDVLVHYNDDLWELSPAELKVRTRPSILKSNLPNIERNIFNELNINVNDFQNYLRNNNLALIVSRNITVRDDADKQQPFNLRVTDTDTVTKTGNGKIYDVSYMQYFQGSLIRSLSFGDPSNPLQGRRVLAQELDNSFNGTSTGPMGSVDVASDGSIAAFVPAERALVWQLTDESGEGVVRERNWLTFQAGEIRVCASCHGVNDKSQANTTEPQNSPLALKELLEKWKDR